MTTDTIPEGTPVRFTADNLGLLRDPDDSKFEGVVNAGDVGTYFRPHPRPNMAGWHLIKVEREGETLYAPVWPNHFTVI